MQNLTLSPVLLQRFRIHRAIWIVVCIVVFFLFTLTILFPGGYSVVHAAPNPPQFNAFWQQDSAAAFSHWTLSGVTLNSKLTALQLTPGNNALTCSANDIDGGKVSYNASAGLCQGHDPLAAGSYNNGLSY